MGDDIKTIQPPSNLFEIRSEPSHFIEMRDGVRLSTDLYFPVGLDRDLPSILIRTPYDKRTWRPGGGSWKRGALFAGQGYVVAIQDLRGKFESEGEYVVARGDGDDGYDTIEWLSDQLWSNGMIGTYGCSYEAEVQFYAAKKQPANLKAMIVQGCGGAVGTLHGRYSFWGFRRGGAIELASGAGWFLKHASKVFYRPPGRLDREAFLRISSHFEPAPQIPDVDLNDLYKSLPVIDMMRKAGAPPSDWEDYVSRALDDPYWRVLDYLTDDDVADVPTLYDNGWFDPTIAETFDEFEHFSTKSASQHACDNQYCVIGPQTHCTQTELNSETHIGMLPVGDARFDYYQLYLDWFDHWLRNPRAGDLGWPKVRFYSMGDNVWRASEEWPPNAAFEHNLYLGGRGRANSLFGDGVLTSRVHTTDAVDTFVFDPDNPTPSLGGPVICSGQKDEELGSVDQRPIEIRHDVLVYTTEPHETDLRVTGPVRAVVHVESSARDADLVLKIADVYPDGRSFNILESILRLRYRDGFDREILLEPGKVYEVAIELGVTSYVFRCGHRLRLQIAGGSFPRFDRNLGTGGRNFDEIDGVAATTKIHHSQHRQSRLILSVEPPLHIGKPRGE